MKWKTIKSKDRVRDHGEVFTPDFIVEEMLNLVKNETERIESRFLEPACGNWNFLIKVLERKIDTITKKYKKNQNEFEKYLIIATWSIYWIDLMIDNIEEAKIRLYKKIEKSYVYIYKWTIKEGFLMTIKTILSKNLIQWNALTLQNKDWEPIKFSQRSLIWKNKIKVREFIFDELIRNESRNSDAQNTLFWDSWKPVFIPEPIKDYPPVHFLDIYTLDT